MSQCQKLRIGYICHIFISSHFWIVISNNPLKTPFFTLLEMLFALNTCYSSTDDSL